MKRITASLLALAMAASLAACGGQASSTAASTASSAAGSADETQAAETVNWPDGGNVTVYVPGSAGGGTDAAARIVTSYLERVTDGTFTVINESSGNGTVACENVRNADPDGMTLIVYHPTMLIQYYQDVYDKDPTSTDNFTVISTLQNGGDGDVLVVPGDAPYDTLEELVDYCKAHPGEVMFGNQNGGFGQMEALQFADAAELDIGFVDSGAQADTITALLGNNIDCCFISLAAAQQYAETGDMKILAICNSEPSVSQPDIPTFISKGYDVVLKVDMVLFGPANMDPALVQTISETLKGMETDEETIQLNANLLNSYTYVDPATSQSDWEAMGATIKNMVGLIGYDVSNK